MDDYLNDYEAWALKLLDSGRHTVRPNGNLAIACKRILALAAEVRRLRAELRRHLDPPAEARS